MTPPTQEETIALLKRLTPKQTIALNQIAQGNSQPNAAATTLNSLVDKGLITRLSMAVHSVEATAEHTAYQCPVSTIKAMRELERRVEAANANPEGVPF